MQVEWYGKSAFGLTAGETTVAIDRFDTGELPARAGPAIVVPAAP